MPAASPHITEPMTMVTDYVLTVECVVFAGALVRRIGWRGTAPLWTAAFAVTALAALAGGTAHGFALYLGPSNHALVWSITVTALAASAVLMIAAGVGSVLRPLVEAREQKRSGHRQLWAAVFLSLMGLAVQQSGFSLHRHFNHNDIYHVVQMFGLYFLYRGALLLNAGRKEKDHPPAGVASKR